jgi:hypothetical protein
MKTRATVRHQLWDSAGFALDSGGCIFVRNEELKRLGAPPPYKRGQRFDMSLQRAEQGFFHVDAIAIRHGFFAEVF